MKGDLDPRDGGHSSTAVDSAEAALTNVVATSYLDRDGWLAFSRDLTARGLTGVRLVTSADSGRSASTVV